MRKIYVITLVLGAIHLFAQFRGHSLFEFQGGNVPNTAPSDLKTAYEQLNLTYRHSFFQGGVRFEGLGQSDSDKAYSKITQYKAYFKHGRSEIKLGHFYGLIGRGLLLRSYEIPGSIYEDEVFRIRYGFYRDLEGVLLKTQGSWFKFKFLSARPLVNVLPPTQSHEDRRPDKVDAGEGSIRWRRQELGFAFLRNTRNHESKDYSTTYLDLQLPWFSLYGEYAQQLNDQTFLNPEKKAPQAFYGSLTYTSGALGLSTEFKDYHNFFLGSGFNDPPPVVREQTYVVLNRSTHVLQVMDETGYQIEGYWHWGNGARLTLNTTKAKNELYRTFTYKENFMEYDTPLGDNRHIKVFVDWAQDPFNSEQNRLSTGGHFEQRISRRMTMTLETEYQQFKWQSFDEFDVENWVFHVGLARSPRYHVTLVYENTTDPRLTDNIKTLRKLETGRRHWFGVALGYQPNYKHQFQLFAGKRRGGPACTSGICYEILDFEGIELRYTTRL